jgi:hypothetical protein
MALAFSNLGLNAPFYVAGLLIAPAVLLAWVNRGRAFGRQLA